MWCHRHDSLIAFNNGLVYPSRQNQEGESSRQNEEGNPQDKMRRGSPQDKMRRESPQDKIRRRGRYGGGMHSAEILSLSGPNKSIIKKWSNCHWFNMTFLSHLVQTCPYRWCAVWSLRAPAVRRWIDPLETGCPPLRLRRLRILHLLNSCPKERWDS